MTPDAVLYRYITVLTGRDIRVDDLHNLICLDAGLLGEWLHGFGGPVESEALHTALKSLDSNSLKRLGLGHIWAVAPPQDAVRLSFDQWRSLVVSSFLAAVLARSLEVSDPDSVRMKILLGLSSISIDTDPLMLELNEFRGAATELLQDAHPVLRISAVVEHFSGENLDAAARVAERLLGLSRTTFQSLVEQAAAEANAAISTLSIEDCAQEKWQALLWQQARLTSFANLLAHQDDLEKLAEIHRLICGSLFLNVPPCFLLDVRDNTLISIGNGFFRDVRIPVLHSKSILARAVRERESFTVSDSTDLIIIDRQLMRRMNTLELHVVPLLAPLEPVGVLVFRADDKSLGAVERMAETYADELSYWLLLMRETSWESSQLLEEYRKAQEKRLREIVHEANNPLSIIHNYLHILELRLQHESGAREQLNMISEEIRRTSDIIKRVVDFPAPGESTPAAPVLTRNRFDLNKVAEKVLELVQGQAESFGVELEKHFSSAEVILVSDEDSVTQAMSNLVKNAVEAMPEGGHIDLETATGVYRSGRPGVEFVVRDTGPGLSEEVIAHLYEPKSFTRGSGLGLHITARLVEELEGAMDLRTAPDRGTAFSVFLPNLENGSEH